MLLELSYRKPLLSFARPDELDVNGQEAVQTELLVAQRLVVEMGRRESKNYCWAAASCVYVDLSQPDQSSLDQDSFRAGFITNVLEPLADDYTTLFC